MDRQRNLSLLNYSISEYFELCSFLAQVDPDSRVIQLISPEKSLVEEAIAKGKVTDFKLRVGTLPGCGEVTINLLNYEDEDVLPRFMKFVAYIGCKK